MITTCKKCGSKNLYLEPRIKGQDVMTADMVALKCKGCGSWLKWCPKDERKYYIHNQPKDKWQKLKEWVEEEIKKYEPTYNEWLAHNSNFYSKTKTQSIYKIVLDKIQELGAEDIEN